MRFNGRKLAGEIEKRVEAQVARLPKRPKLVSVLVGNSPASELYTRLKRQAAARVGIKFEVLRLSGHGQAVSALQRKIRECGGRRDVDGLMIQLPLPEKLRSWTSMLVEEIPLKKDVDGMRWEVSGVVPATVQAVVAILERIERDKAAVNNLGWVNLWERRFVVVGNRGNVGKPLVRFLQRRGVKKISGVNRETRAIAEVVQGGEVVISCTGREGIVTGEMVRRGAILIDVGAPRGEMTREAYEKAAVAAEVPGGVGPVTVASLLANAMELVE